METTPSDRSGASTGLHSSGELFARARDGNQAALHSLFRRNMRLLTRWAHGRLPRWARRVKDTADIVQEALLQTFQRLDRFENRGTGALQAYLRQAVINRIHDELRRVARRPTTDIGDAELDLPSDASSPFDLALDAEHERKYKAALATLSEDERILVVGRMELGYNYDQLALLSKRSTSEAARLAVRRAVLKIAQRMSGA
jgi:RNA polymerase sigma-70 factor (ECF subfamily)